MSLLYIPLPLIECSMCQWSERMEVPEKNEDAYVIASRAHWQMSPLCHEKYGADFVTVLIQGPVREE